MRLRTIWLPLALLGAAACTQHTDDGEGRRGSLEPQQVERATGDARTASGEVTGGAINGATPDANPGPDTALHPGAAQPRPRQPPPPRRMRASVAPNPDAGTP